MANKYLYAPIFRQIFRDKDTTLPLFGGKIFFYKDANRTTLKPVYKQTGTPGSYTYTVYETNPDGSVPINAYGILDHGLYMYPYDSEGNIELYYFVVQNNAGVTQYTQEGFPPGVELDPPTPVIGTKDYNYITNGQLLLHYLLPSGGGKNEGEVRAEITDIGPGEWSFQRSPSTMAEDYVLYQRNQDYISTPPQNPRYWLDIRCNNPADGDAVKDVRVKFNDVNFLASAAGYITLSWWMQSISTAQTIELYVIKNFGTGGSAQTETLIDSFNITTTAAQFTKSFQLGTNTGKTIGEFDDDYVQFAWRYPLDAQFRVLSTNYLLYNEMVTSPQFPALDPLEVINTTGALWEPGDKKESFAVSDYGFWLVCDGRALNRVTYYKLFQRIGTIFGSGDGSTTFNIPDRRGRASIGAGAGPGLTARTLGQTGGAETASLVEANNGPHTHGLNGLYGVATVGPGGTETFLHGQSPPGTSLSESSGSGTPFSIMNPFLVENVFIYTGEI